jgi:hypothetical protein
MVSMASEVEVAMARSERTETKFGEGLQPEVASSVLSCEGRECGRLAGSAGCHGAVRVRVQETRV